MTPEGAQLNQSLSPMLTEIAVGIGATMSNTYIAKSVFPNVPVAAPSGQYNVWKRGDFMRRQAKRLGNFEAPPVVGFSTGKGSYSVNHYGASAAWTAIDLANARIGGTPDQKFINGKMRVALETNLIELEIQTATLCTTAGNWSTTIAGVSSGPTAGQFLQWDQTASDPVTDVLNACETMRLTYGLAPNLMLLPRHVWITLKKNAALLDRIKYGGLPDAPAEVTLNMLKELFEIDQIIITDSVYNTAATESDTAAFSYIWGSLTIWMGYVPSAPSQDEPSAGYHFSWTGNTSQGLPVGTAQTGVGPQSFGSVESPEGLFVFEYTQNRPRASFIDVELWTTPNIVGADFGLTMTAVLSA